MKTLKEMTLKEIYDLEADCPLQIGFNGFSKQYRETLAKREPRVAKYHAPKAASKKKAG